MADTLEQKPESADSGYLTVEMLIDTAKALGASIDSSIKEIARQATEFNKLMQLFSDLTGKPFSTKINPLTLSDAALICRNNILELRDAGQIAEKNTAKIEAEYDAVISVLTYLTEEEYSFRKSERFRPKYDIAERVADLKSHVEPSALRRAKLRFFKRRYLRKEFIIPFGLGVIALVIVILLFTLKRSNKRIQRVSANTSSAAQVVDTQVFVPAGINVVVSDTQKTSSQDQTQKTASESAAARSTTASQSTAAGTPKKRIVKSTTKRPIVKKSGTGTAIKKTGTASKETKADGTRSLQVSRQAKDKARGLHNIGLAAGANIGALTKGDNYQFLVKIGNVYFSNKGQVSLFYNYRITPNWFAGARFESIFLRNNFEARLFAVGGYCLPLNKIMNLDFALKLGSGFNKTPFIAGAGVTFGAEVAKTEDFSLNVAVDAGLDACIGRADGQVVSGTIGVGVVFKK